MKRYRAWLLLLSPLALMGQGCPNFGILAVPPGLRPAPAIVVNQQIDSLQVTFTVNLDNHPETSSINWDFGDTTTALNLPPSTGRSVTHTFPASGLFAVRVFLFADARTIGTGTTSVAVQGPNQNPVASFVSSTVDNAPQPRTIRFDAGGSTDADGSIASFAWNFGDNSAAGSGQVVEHTYAAPGQFTVSLTVTDDRGGTGSTTRSVVANIAPVAMFTSTPTDDEEPGILTVDFDAAASSDADGSLASFEWNFGDNSPTVTGAMVQHTYAERGRFDVRLTVTDNLGSINTLTTPLDLLGDFPQVVSITPTVGEVNTIATISRLAGNNFMTGATVRLVRTGQPDINAANVVVSNESRITCTFDLNGAATGDYTIVVTNPGGFDDTLVDGFRVVTANRVRIATSLGDIVLQMDRVAAPGHVNNFYQYIEERRYDGVVFHRVPPNNFVIQAGAFESNGAGSNPRLTERQGLPPINSEAPNGRSNVRGTISLALRGQDANSGTNQFFINVGNNTSLDTGPPRFTVFGDVVEGLSVVDAIAAVQTADNVPVQTLQGPANFSDVPTTDVTINTVRRE